jgi:hypothetical protein
MVCNALILATFCGEAATQIFLKLAMLLCRSDCRLGPKGCTFPSLPPIEVNQLLHINIRLDVDCEIYPSSLIHGQELFPSIALFLQSKAMTSSPSIGSK